METEFRARLLNRTDAGSRVDWDARPQGKPLPAITLTNVSSVRARHMGGVQATQSSLVQIDCWAATAKAAKELADEVVAIIEPGVVEGSFRFFDATTTIRSAQPTETPTGMVHHRMIDAEVFYTPIP